MLELRTYGLHPVTTSAARSWATGLEDESLRTAVEL
jgi:hypothetical protein